MQIQYIVKIVYLKTLAIKMLD